MNILRYALLASLMMLTGCASFGILSTSDKTLTQKYTNETSRYVKVDNLTFHYQDEGTGPVLVLLHGVASSSHTWDGWVKELSPYYRIIRIDLPGHGLTGPDNSRKNYDIDYMTDMLSKLLVRLKVDKAHIAGNSLGGYIAWNYAVKNPEKVDKLILLDSAGFPQKMPFIMRFASWPGIGEMSQVFMPRFIVSQNVKRAYGDKSKVDKKLVRRYHDLTLRKGNRKALVSTFREMKRQSKNEQLGANVKGVKAPTLLMWGELDTWVPLDVMEQFRQNLEDVKLVTYEGVGHMPMEEIPVQTARDAHYFIETGRPFMPAASVE